MKKVRGAGFIQGFDWGLYPTAEKFILKEVNNFLKHNKFANGLAKIMHKETSTSIFDWIDHIVVPDSRTSEESLKKLGFKRAHLKSPNGTVAFKNTKSIFPPVLLSRGNTTELCLKPEYLINCVNKLNKVGTIKGEKYAPIRKATIHVQKNYVLTAIERRGSNNFVIDENPEDVKQYRKAFKVFSKRKRHFNSDKQGIKAVKKLVKNMLNTLSPSRTADAFFRNERAYWERKNHAGLTQRKRQDKLGLGWGNHDHHTYRSSREHFTDLIEIFEMMGYKCRERFFAGERAGWGAQVLEHPQCDIVVFADLDITKEEKDKDFAHLGVARKRKLGTVGMWIGLHGESILQSGMHHLEARFTFDKLRKDLNKHGVGVMKPFSNFKFLKQAFTEGEKWKVEKKRITKLLKYRSISIEQYHGFLTKGAIGSHLENLQRRQGYKGFNQNSVTAIIKAVNPINRLIRKEAYHKGA